MTLPARVGRVIRLAMVCSPMLALFNSTMSAEICASVTPVLDAKPPASGYAGAPYELTIGPEKLASCTNLSYWLDFGSGNTCSAASWSSYYLTRSCSYTTPGGPYQWTAKVSADGGKTVLWSQTGEITISDPAVDCKNPAFVVMASPPAVATSRAYYPLTLGPSKISSCLGDEYWLDFGFPATPQCSAPGWTGSQNRTCPYPAPGTYTWTAKARGPGFPEFSRSGITTVYDCTLTCDGQFPATGQVGAPIAFTWTATPSHCTPRWWVRWGVTITPTSGVDNDSCMSEPCRFTFSKPGTYDWSLVTQARWGGPSIYKECFDTGKITIAGAAELKVGNLTFKGTSLTQNGTTYTLAGPVQVNEVLRFPGQVVFTGNPASGKGELSTNAAAQVSTTPATTTILSGSSQVSYTVDGTTSPGQLTPRLLPGLAALDFSLDGVPLYLLPGEPIGVSTTGVRLYPTLFVGTADFHLAVLRLHLGLQPTKPVELLAGSSLVSGTGVPGIQVISVPKLALDAAGRLSGQIEVDFPFLEITRLGSKTTLQMNLLNRGGCFDELELAPGTASDLAVRMGGRSAPFLYLGFFDASTAITGICSPPLFAPLFPGTFGFHEEGRQSYFGVADSLWAYETPHTFRLLRGAPTFLSQVGTDATATWVGLGDADVLLMKRPLDLKVGGESLVAGTLRAGVVSWKESDTVKTWRALGELVGLLRLDSRCPCPPGGGIECEAARLGLLELFGNQMSFPDRHFDLVASGSAENSAFTATFAGRAVFPGLTRADVTIVRSAKADGAGDNRCWFGSNLAARTLVKPAALLEIQATGVERAVTLVTTEELAIFAARGKSAITPSIFLVNPAGQKITPGTVGSFPTVTYGTDAPSRLALFAVRNAAAGTWKLGEDNLPESDVELTALAPLPPPVTAFTQVGTSGTSRSITASVTPASTSTKVSLYCSRTHDGLPESTIAADLPATGGSVTATWDTAPLPSGTYYLFAVTDDGRNSPVTTFHATPITIDVGGLTSPTNLQAVRSGQTVTLTWTPSTSTAVVGYTVMYTDQPDQPGYTGSAPALRPSVATVTNLGYSRSYRFCVAGFDLNGNMTPLSTSVVVPPGKGRARRNFGN